MRFITSLNPKNIAKCQECVQSWTKFTQDIVAVQTHGEIETLQPHFPSVNFVLTDHVGVIFESLQCPSIDSLLDQGPGLIINSDISIHTTIDAFQDKFQDRQDKVLDCGIRWDYVESHANRTMNPYGIDAFKITSDLIPILKGTHFTIGQPGWDYYFILEAHKHGYYINSHKNPPMFYHEVHDINWARWKLTLAQALLEKMYDGTQSEITRKVQKLTNRVGVTRRRRK